MNQDQKERLQNITGFCGYGNPDTSELFFMGIEEHHHFKDPQSVYKKDSNTFTPYYFIPSDGVGSGSTVRMQLRIYKCLFGNINNKDDKTLFKEDIHSFNYYPLGAAKASSLPQEYPEIFGFANKSDLYKYFDEESERKQILKQFIENQILNKNKILFVLGKSIWDKAGSVIPDIMKPLEKYDQWNTKNGRPAAIRYSKDYHVYFTGHPSHGCINDEVIKFIKDLKDQKK